MKQLRKKVIQDTMGLMYRENKSVYYFIRSENFLTGIKQGILMAPIEFHRQIGMIFINFIIMDIKKKIRKRLYLKS